MIPAFPFGKPCLNREIGSCSPFRGFAFESCVEIRNQLTAQTSNGVLQLQLAFFQPSQSDPIRCHCFLQGLDGSLERLMFVLKLSNPYPELSVVAQSALPPCNHHPNRSLGKTTSTPTQNAVIPSWPCPVARQNPPL